MPRPFIIRGDEYLAVKHWLIDQTISNDHCQFRRYQVDEEVTNPEQAKAFVLEHLSIEERKKLNVALAVRRKRAEDKKTKGDERLVKTELTAEARKMLSIVAQHQKSKPSEILSAIVKEHLSDAYKKALLSGEF